MESSDQGGQHCARLVNAPAHECTWDFSGGLENYGYASRAGNKFETGHPSQDRENPSTLERLTDARARTLEVIE